MLSVHRHTAQRAQQLKSAVNDLRKAVSSTVVRTPSAQQQQQAAVKAEEDASAEGTQSLSIDQQSGRLQALGGLVSALTALGKLVLVVAQSSKVCVGGSAGIGHNTSRYHCCIHFLVSGAACSYAQSSG